MEGNPQARCIKTQMTGKPVGLPASQQKRWRAGGLAEDQDHGDDKVLQVTFNFL